MTPFRGGCAMVQQYKNKLNKLSRKVDQHEETIAQLVVIIAETNRRISELSTQESKTNHRRMMTL